MFLVAVKHQVSNEEYIIVAKVGNYSLFERIYFFQALLPSYPLDLCHFYCEYCR